MNQTAGTNASSREDFGNLNCVFSALLSVLWLKRTLTGVRQAPAY